MALSFSEMRMYANRRILAALLAITLVALGTTGAVIYCVNQLLQGRQASIQITKVQAEVDSLMVALLNAESAQRGYLLTSDEAYLQHYGQAVGQAKGAAAILVKQTAQTSYADKIREVQSITNNKLAELDTTISAHRDQGAADSLAIVEGGQGLRDMDRIRSILTGVGQSQTTRLASLRAQTTEYGVWTSWISGGMLLVISALAGLVYYWFLQAIQSERALDRAKDEFVSLASHQLRTPATGIRSILSVLQAGDVGALNERQQHLINRAVESNDRGLRIVDELLNVARADSGRLVLRPADLDLRRVIESAATEQRRLIEAKGQNLIIDEIKKPVPVMADEEKIHMAVSNLIDNASKYTPNGGTIHIKIRNLQKSVGIEVSDTGVGMDKSELAVIFDRFQRAHGILMSGVEGTGLGLYLVRRIVELHNGSIEVVSRRGEGSTFKLTLPRKGRPDAA
jgi:signal transduction histidine kinase